MKKLLYTIASLAALTAIACTKEQGTPEVRPEIPDTPEEVIEVPATLSGSMGDPTTKVSNDNNGAYKWQASDHVTILTNNGANREFSADEAGLTTEFSGHIPNTDALVGGFALYPASSDLEAAHHSISGTTITFNIPTTLTWGADASYMPMYAPIATDPDNAEKVKASFKAVGGAMKLICYNIPAGATTLAFTAKVKIAGNFTLDTTAETPTLSGEGGGMEIDIDFTGNYSANKVFYIPLPPVTLTDGFTITIFDSDEKKLFEKSTTAAPAIGRNHLVIAPALNCEAVLWSEDFSGFSNGNVPSGEQESGVTYACTNGTGSSGSTKIYSEDTAGGTAPELLICKYSGTFTVTGIPTKNATSMVLKFKKNAQSLTVSTTSSITLGGDTSTSTSGEKTVTLTNNGGLSSFDLTFTGPSGNNNVRIDDIKLINPNSTVTAPSIDAPDALTIGVGESSASTTVTLANAVDNLGISALVSGTNADKFTAAISGTTLTVTAKETNSSAADYTATVTLKASGATAKAIAVTQTTNLVPNPALTATPESGEATVTWAKDSHASDYVAYLHTAETETPATGGTTVTGSISTVNNNCTLSLTGLKNGTTYHVYVKVNGVAENYTAPTTDFAHVAFTPVAAKELVSIELTENPTQTTYNVGGTFSLTGAVVTANYNDSTTADVTSECTTSYDFSTMGAKTVTISYTEGNNTRTCNCYVTVAGVDVLTRSTTGVTGTGYTSWSGKSKNTEGSGILSDAVYAGQSAGGNDAIQLRSDNNNSGIVTTTSGGIVKKITVTWNSNTIAGRTLNVYGKNSSYSDATDLYNNNTQGTLLGTIVKGTSTELTVTGEYGYIGLRSAASPMFIDEIDIKWEPATPTITMAKTSISGVAAAGVNNTTESGVYTFENGATDADVTVTCDGSVVTSATKNNGSITYTVAANTGAARDGWIKVQYGTEDPHAVTVSQNAATYTLTLSSGGNGTVTATVDEESVASGSAVSVGKTVSITTTPSSGYQLSALSYNDGSAHDIISTKSFTMPSAAVTVSATFAAVPTITVDKTSITGVAAAGVANASESGVYSFHNGATDANVTVTCDGTIVTAASKNNGAITYTVDANTTAARSGWIKVQYGSEDPHTITVSQLVAMYTLRVTSADNGTVSATVGGDSVSEGNNISVAYGSTVSVTANADSNYELSTLVYNDGTTDHDIKSASPSFTMPSADVSITAVFVAKANEYTYIFTSKSWAATRGGNQENWVSGQDGGQLTSGRGIQVTEAASGANGTSPNSFTDVEEVIVTYSTNANAGVGSILVKVGNGTAKSSSVTKTGGTTDRELTFSYTTKESGKVNVTVNCTTNSIYIKSVTIKAANMVIPVAHTITCASVTNGSISSDKASAYADETVTLTATADTDYQFESWSVYKTGEPGATIAVSENTFTMPDYDVTVSATFSAIPPTISVTNPIGGVSATAGTYTINDAYTLLHGASSGNVTVGEPDNTVVTAVSKGASDGSISITVNGNTGAARNGSFKIKYGNEAYRTITVNQLAGVVTPTEVTVQISDYASAHSWSNGEKYTSVSVDSHITVTVSGGANTGKYYTSGKEWRLYQTESATITISAENGYTIDQVKYTYNISNTGTLKDNSTSISSDTAVNVNAGSKTLSVGNTGSATNGQVKITKIYVKYH